MLFDVVLLLLLSVLFVGFRFDLLFMLFLCVSDTSVVCFVNVLVICLALVVFYVALFVLFDVSCLCCFRYDFCFLMCFDVLSICFVIFVCFAERVVCCVCS